MKHLYLFCSQKRLDAIVKRLIGLVIFLLSVSYSSAQGQGFTNADFMALPATQQKGFLDGIMHTLWQVAAQKDTTTGQCVFDWYYKDVHKKNSLILASMEKYRDYSLAPVIIGLTEIECGKYVRGKAKES